MRNEYEVRGETTAILIKRRNGDVYEALVDTSDLEKLLEFDVKWIYFKTGNNPMAKANRYSQDKRRTLGSILLNRFLLDFPEGKEVSFASENKLDCRRSNLRLTTHAETTQNRKSADVDSLTGVRNVTYKKSWGKFVVNVNKTYLGGYDTLEEAEKVAIEQRKILYPTSTD